MLAVACGLWAAAFLAPDGIAAFLLAPPFVPAVLACRRWPVPAALAAQLVALAHLPLGVPSENPSDLAATFTAVFALGRWGTGRGRCASTGDQRRRRVGAFGL